MITFINGDLLEIEQGIILHQVNCKKVCGGLAGALNCKFPLAFNVYFDDLRPESDRLGTALIGRQGQVLYIAHIFGQLYPGPNTDLKAVDSALTELGNLVHPANALPIYAPDHMGCGLGGGDWPKYLALLEYHFPDINIVKK